MESATAEQPVPMEELPVPNQQEILIVGELSWSHTSATGCSCSWDETSGTFLAMGGRCKRNRNAARRDQAARVTALRELVAESVALALKAERRGW